jgi:hypothetical protein
MKKEFDAALKKENESKEMCENQNIAADEASSGNRRTLPRLCEPGHVAEAGSTGRGKHSTRKRKQTYDVM